MNDYQKTAPECRGAIMRVVCILEGAKTHIKALHWAAKNYDEHIVLDKVLDEVSEYQDKIAEGMMGIYGKILPSELKPIAASPESTPAELVNALCDISAELLVKTDRPVMLAGVRSETEAFLQEMTKYSYLLSLC